MTQHREGFVAGIDFSGTKVALVTADLAGRRLAAQRFPAQAGEGADGVVERTLAAARDLIEQTAASTATRLAAAAAVSPGAGLPGRSLLAPDSPGWGGPAPEELARGLRIHRVAVGNEAKAAALAEARWGTLAGRGPGIFLYLGTRPSAALVVNGRVVAGAHGAAGEPLTTGQAFAQASSNPQLQLASGTLDALAAHIANLALVVDPATIAVGGELAHGAGIILPRLRATLERAVPFPPTVQVAHFTQDAPLVGAVALALDAVQLGARPTSAPPDERAGDPARAAALR